MPSYRGPEEDFAPREGTFIVSSLSKRTSPWKDWDPPEDPQTLRASPFFLFKNVPWQGDTGLLHRDVWITTEIDADMSGADSFLAISMEPGRNELANNLFTTTRQVKCGGQPSTFFLDPFDPEIGANPIDPARAGNPHQYLVAISGDDFEKTRRDILRLFPDPRDFGEAGIFEPEHDVIFDFRSSSFGTIDWETACLPVRNFALRVNLNLEFSTITTTPLELKLWGEDTCQNAVFAPRFPEIPVTEANPHGNSVAFPLLTTTHKVRAMSSLAGVSAGEEVCKFHNAGADPNVSTGSGFVVGADGFARGAYCSQRAGTREANHFADPFIIQMDDGDITQEDQTKWGLQGQVPAGFCGFIGGYEAPIWTEVEYWSEQHICGGFL